MTGKLPLNGCDYLMLAFDHELRRLGYSGNSCQVILELGSKISVELLEKRLIELCRRYPVTQAIPAGLFVPSWKPPRSSRSAPALRTHREDTGIYQRLFNERLDTKRGELFRLDLVETNEGKHNVVFTWAHALMDAPSAEYLLALIGREDLTPPAEENGQPRRSTTRGLVNRMKLAWKTLYRIDKMGEAGPQSLGTRNPHAPPQMRFRVEKFSPDESQRVRANAARLAGPVGAAQYHAAATMVELHRLHERLGRPSASYVLPVPVGLRPKGSCEPIFSNQVTMLMTQFMPVDTQSVEKSVTLLKGQMQEAMRANLLESGQILSEMFRFLPLSLYMSVLKKGLSGEICSLFYGDTATVNPHLTTFLGAPIRDFVHVAAITPSPGIGVIFYYFQGNLRVTVLHLLPMISENEAAEFAANLRKRLLEP